MKIQNGLCYLSLSILITMMVLGQSSASTPAGTIISAKAQCTYLNSAGTAMPTTVSSAATVTVTQTSAIICAVDSPSQTISPGGSAQYILTIANRGNAADSYTVTISTTASGWQAGILTTTGSAASSVQTPSVQPDTSTSVNAILTAPAQASAGTVCAATISVVSRTDTTVKQSLSLSAVVQRSNCLRDWLIMGTFSDGTTSPLLCDYLGGEPNVAPGIGYSGVTWNERTSKTDAMDLGAIFGNPQNCAAYAGLYIYSDMDQSAVLSYTSTGPNVVWLNGSAVSVQQTGPDDPTEAQNVNVHLFEGANRLLMKFATSAGPWQFSAQLVDTSGNPLGNVLTSTLRENSDPISFSGVQAISVDSSDETVMWTTSEPTSTILTYSCAGVTLSVQDPALTLQHTVNLTDLQPGTTYVYTLAGLDAFTCPVSAQNTSFTTAAVVPTWITNWLVNGVYYSASYGSYYGTSLATDFLHGEAFIMPSPGSVSNSRVWKPAVTNNTGVLDFTNCYGAASYCLAYAHVYVYSPSAQSAILLTGSDDGMAALLNGQLVFMKSGMRTFAPDQDSTPVTLMRGWNSLMVKVIQYNGSWRLCARFVSPTGAPLPSLSYQINRP